MILTAIGRFAGQTATTAGFLDKTCSAFVMKPLFVPILHHVTRLGLAVVFVFAGFVKLGDISEFAVQVGKFGLVYDTMVLPVAWAVALAEVLAGSALAFNVRGSLSFVTILLVVFVAALVYGIALGLDIDCGCFGPAYHVDLKTQLFLDLGLLVWCGIVFRTAKRYRARTGAARGTSPTDAHMPEPTP